MFRPTLLALCLASAVQAQDRPLVAPADAPSQLRITNADEPGQSLRITGRVVDAAGAPVARASLYVYETDQRGHYTPEEAGANRRARIHGYLRTDGNGQFEIVTIRPGSYPGTRIPQHVHFVVSASGFADRVFEIVFSDDPFVDARVRESARRPNSMYSICQPVRQGDRTHCTEQIALNRAGGGA